MGASHVFPPKDPLERRNYTIDLSKILASGETITSVNFTQDTPATGLTISTPTIATDGKSASTQIIGGVDGEKYIVLISGQTSSLQIFARRVVIPVKNR